MKDPGLTVAGGEIPGTRGGRDAALEIAALGALLVGYLVLRVLSQPLPWAVLLLPNLWLLGSSLVWLRRRPTAFRLIRGGRRVKVGAALTAALAAGLLIGSTGAVELGGDWRDYAEAGILIGLVPAAEELFFRGLLLDHLNRETDPWTATLLVSALFGFLHLPSGSVGSMALLSALFCAVTLRTRSLLWPLLLHAGGNAVSGLLQVLSASDAEPVRLVTVGGLIAGTAWVVFSRERRPRG